VSSARPRPARPPTRAAGTSHYDRTPVTVRRSKKREDDGDAAPRRAPAHPALDVASTAGAPDFGGPDPPTPASAWSQSDIAGWHRLSVL
jgi:hypothetical protein